MSGFVNGMLQGLGNAGGQANTGGLGQNVPLAQQLQQTQLSQQAQALANQGWTNAQNNWSLGAFGGLGGWTPPTAADTLNELRSELQRYRLNYVSIERLERMLSELTARVELGAAIAAHVTPEWYARYEKERERVRAERAHASLARTPLP